MYSKLKSLYKPLIIYDSGLGGLYLAKRLKQAFPFQDIICFLDREAAPLGLKTSDQVYSRVKQIYDIMLAFDPSQFLLGCYTASFVFHSLNKNISIDTLSLSALLIDEITKATKNESVMVLSTQLTAAHIGGIFYQNPRLLIQPCQNWASHIEFNHDNSSISNDISFLTQMVTKQNISSIYLACTHYPLIESFDTVFSSIPIKIHDLSEKLIDNISQKSTLGSGSILALVSGDSIYDYNHLKSYGLDDVLTECISINPIKNTFLSSLVCV